MKDTSRFVVMSWVLPPAWTNTSDLTLFLQSPILVNHAYTMNGVSIGSTQYDDAFQQANFWSLVGGAIYLGLRKKEHLEEVTHETPAENEV